MSFDVTVINKGNFQEVSIPVTFKLAHSGAKTITKTQTIASIDPGQKTIALVRSTVQRDQPSGL